MVGFVNAENLGVVRPIQSPPVSRAASAAPIVVPSGPSPSPAAPVVVRTRSTPAPPVVVPRPVVAPTELRVVSAVVFSDYSWGVDMVVHSVHHVIS